MPGPHVGLHTLSCRSTQRLGCSVNSAPMLLHVLSLASAVPHQPSKPLECSHDTDDATSAAADSFGSTSSVNTPGRRAGREGGCVPSKGMPKIWAFYRAHMARLRRTRRGKFSRRKVRGPEVLLARHRCERHISLLHAFSPLLFYNSSLIS